MLVIKADSLHNESDVEQKLVYPLLVAEKPYGLGFDSLEIRTKLNIKAFEIGKRKNRKIYFPDYIVVISGLPLLIVEVKPPSEELDEAYREARLYANEINSLYRHNVNPASKIICTNGRRIIASFSDSDDSRYDLSLDELDPVNPNFFKFIDEFNAGKLRIVAEQLQTELYSSRYYQPLRKLGGQSVRNEEVGTNSFGNTIALEYQHLFNPTAPQERAYIVENAYILSKSRQRYIDPIDRVVRAAIPPSESDSKAIYSAKPKALLETLKKVGSGELEHKVLLLIGGVGSGKSTFVDFLLYKALPKELIAKTAWVRIDMNDAPLDTGIIYGWICEQIITEFRRNNSDTDFDDLENLMKIYSNEISQFNKGRGKLHEGREYNLELSRELERLQVDKKLTAKAYLRHLCAERGKLGVIVLDNCDKRIRDEQLLMFQAAQWIQHEFRCLIFLPLRDVTYDNHRNEPPLDTALKDLVFRIEPPRFQDVLVARIKLALAEMQKKSQEKTLTYQLPNTMKVSFPAEKLAYFLTSILKSLFEYDRYLRRIIVGLAGGDIRKATEIFLDFCKSGHITEDEILKICHAEGKYPIPFNIVSRVLTRMNRRFYNSDSSYVKNIFYCNPADSKPFHFTRFAVLRWLHSRHKILGTIKQRGYHSVASLKADLFLLGLSEEAVSRELLYLLQARCIIAEHLRIDQLDNDDLVSLSPAGFVHLEIMNTPDYLSAISEETYFDDEKVAESIATQICDRNRQYTSSSVLSTSKTLIDYLQPKLLDRQPSDAFLENLEWENLLSIDDAIEVINSKAIETGSVANLWLNVRNSLKEGDVLEGVVKNTTDFGVFIGLKGYPDGCILNEQLESSKLSELKKFQKVRVIILSIDLKRKRIRLGLEESKVIRNRKKTKPNTVPLAREKETINKQEGHKSQKKEALELQQNTTEQLEINFLPEES